MAFLNYTEPPTWWYTDAFTYPEQNFSIPNIQDFTGQLPPTPATNPILVNVTFALRVVLFITCLSENSIAVFILHKNIRNGRQTFAQFMLINIASVDILSSIINYSSIFVTFSHGRFVWLVPGLIGDILCKLYNFLLDLLGKILIFSLVALACDAARNSSRKGRREHSKKFSLICTVLFWLIAAGFSVIYLKISKVQPNFLFYECSTDRDNQVTVTMLDIFHAYVFVGMADVILAIVDLIVFIRVRRRRKEMKTDRRHKGQKKRSKYHTKIGRQMRVGVLKSVNILDQMSPDEVDQEVQSTTSRETGADIEVNDQSDTSSNSSVEFIEMSGAMENENIAENIEAKVIRITKASAINERGKRHAKQKKGRKPQPHNGSDDEESPSANDADQSAQEERFKTTRKEALIMGAISSLFVILSLAQMILPIVCPSCSVYIFHAILMAMEIYAVIKPGIYASIDKEFREKYKQLSLIACCCFRRIRCRTVSTVQQV